VSPAATTSFNAPATSVAPCGIENSKIEKPGFHRWK